MNYWLFHVIKLHHMLALKGYRVYTHSHSYAHDKENPVAIATKYYIYSVADIRVY